MAQLSYNMKGVYNKQFLK